MEYILKEITTSMWGQETAGPEKGGSWSYFSGLTESEELPKFREGLSSWGRRHTKGLFGNWTLKKR